MGDDLHAVELWASIFTDKVKLEATVTKNLLMHKAAIQTDFESLKTDYEGAKYFDAGKVAGDALILVLGPVHPTKP